MALVANVAATAVAGGSIWDREKAWVIVYQPGGSHRDGKRQSWAWRAGRVSAGATTPRAPRRAERRAVRAPTRATTEALRATTRTRSPPSTPRPPAARACAAPP